MDRARLLQAALLLLALPGAALALVAFLNTLGEFGDSARPDARLLLVFVPLWGAGAAAYAWCWWTLPGVTATPWLLSALLLGVGAWPLMLSGIGILALAAALALAVGARLRTEFRQARPLTLLLGVAAAAATAWFVFVNLQGGALLLDMVFVALLAGIAIASLWPSGQLEQARAIVP